MTSKRDEGGAGRSLIILFFFNNFLQTIHSKKTSDTIMEENLYPPSILFRAHVLYIICHF